MRFSVLAVLLAATQSLKLSRKNLVTIQHLAMQFLRTLDEK